MASLYAFLNPVPVTEQKEVIVSDRFRDEDGNVVPFIIKPISQEFNNRLSERATKSKLVRGQKVEMFDNAAYTNMLVVECCVQPDFRDAEICKRYGTLDGYDVPSKMLMPGEFATLSEAILKLNGFDIGAVPQIEEDAKN